MYRSNGFDPVRLQIEKAIRALQFVAGRMGQHLFSSDEERGKWAHDLEVIHRMNNLQAVSAEYIGADRIVLFKQEIGFSPNGHTNGAVFDSAGGVEPPLCPLEMVKLIKETRLLITEHDRSQAGLYRDLLQIPWTSAEPLKKAKGTSFRSEHHEKITRGNNTATMFVSELARHRGWITHVAEGRGYAFARDDTLGRQVWLHLSHAAKGFVFRKGLRVSYIVVDVPKGLQGRDIQVT